MLDKITSPIRLHRSKKNSNFFSKSFRSFSKTFRLFRDFENFSRNRSRRDDSFGPKIVEFRAILAIFRPFEDLDVRPDVQPCQNWRCNLLQHAMMSTTPACKMKVSNKNIFQTFVQKTISIFCWIFCWFSFGGSIDDDAKKTQKMMWRWSETLWKSSKTSLNVIRKRSNVVRFLMGALLRIVLKFLD